MDPAATIAQQARSTALALLDAYGRNAIVGAKAALRAASVSGDIAAIELWAAICALLAVDAPQAGEPSGKMEAQYWHEPTSSWRPMWLREVAAPLVMSSHSA